jgi:hypothetical protein
MHYKIVYLVYIVNRVYTVNRVNNMEVVIENNIFNQ